MGSAHASQLWDLLLKTLWPSGLRRWLKAPLRKGVGSNPTGVIFLLGRPALLCIPVVDGRPAILPEAYSFLKQRLSVGVLAILVEDQLKSHVSDKSVATAWRLLQKYEKPLALVLLCTP